MNKILDFAERVIRDYKHILAHGEPDPAKFFLKIFIDDLDELAKQYPAVNEHTIALAKKLPDWTKEEIKELSMLMKAFLIMQI